MKVQSFHMPRYLLNVTPSVINMTWSVHNIADTQPSQADAQCIGTTMAQATEKVNGTGLEQLSKGLYGTNSC